MISKIHAMTMRVGSVFGRRRRVVVGGWGDDAGVSEVEDAVLHGCFDVLGLVGGSGLVSR